VTVHLDALERKGYIQRSNTPRSIKIIHPSFQQSNEVSMLPLLGSIAAGEPILADQNVECHLPVPSQMVRNAKDAYLLRIKGDSMIGDGIMDNDIVVVKPQDTANDGELVAVLLGDGATVKRLNKKGPIVKLMPSNPKYEPIEVAQENAWVLGKVLGLFRDFEGLAF
jgi:repressor LexA